MFYERLEQICKIKGVAPVELRKALDIKQSTMASWKARGITPGNTTVKKMADYLQVPMGAFYDDHYDDALLMDNIQAHPHKDGTNLTIGGVTYFTTPPIVPAEPDPEYLMGIRNVTPESMKGKIYQSIGFRVRQVREAKGLTLVEFAQKSDIPESTINHCESGVAEELTAENILRICVSLDARLSDFINFPLETADIVETLCQNLHDVGELPAHDSTPSPGNGILSALQKKALMETTLAYTEAILLSIRSEIQREAELSYFSWLNQQKDYVSAALKKE